MTFKRTVKMLLPRPVSKRIGSILMQRRQRRLSQMKIQDAFDEIYKKGMWKQGGTLSGVGSEGSVADQYVQFVLAYAKKNGLRTVVDGGCGDFSIGSRLAPKFEWYRAFDISPYIIETNKGRFAELTARHHVTFEVADMTTQFFPTCDLVLIRQVLQHLTNGQVEQILANLESSMWRRALITEEVHDPENNQNPNLDLRSHSVGNRVALGSGVFIDREPFARRASRVAVIRKHGAPTSGSALLIFELKQAD